MGKRVLLFNPPGRKRYIRDYYCSKVSKSGYLFHPIDLLMMSGRLSELYQVFVLDSVVEKLSFEDSLKRVIDLKPDVIVWLTGTVSWDEDKDFIAALRDKIDYVSISSGDLFLELGAERLKKQNIIDAVVLDFMSDDIIKYLGGDLSSLNNMIYRSNGDVIEAPVLRERRQEFVLPVPRHDLFRNRKYHFTFSKHRAFATVLTDFGCPYKCSFCIMGNLGFRYRSLDNVLDELTFIKNLKINEIFFADQTFGAIGERSKELCERIISENLDFGWTCFSRVDVVDETTLRLWQKAGCHTIIFGVETASEELLRTYRKGYTKEQIKNAFEICNRLGIQTVGTFILGLPEETEETARETIEFAKNIKCDFFSFNFAVPRFGTKLRADSIQTGLVQEEMISMDQSGSSISMASKYLTKEEIKDLKRKIVKKFYLRPGYFWQRLMSVKSVYQFWNQVREGLYLVWSTLRERRDS